MKLAEKRSYIEEKDQLVVETIYDPTATIEANKAQRNSGEREYFGSKNQRMLKVASIDMDHVLALRNMGYDLLSPDPAQVKRALLYIQTEQPVWMVVDGKPIAERNTQWV
jgi:hypothetical protein